MKVVVLEDPGEAARRIVAAILSALARKPDLVLGLATGSTPLEVYEGLVRARREKGFDFSRVTTFNLDEYLDLPEDHEQSYRSFMRRHLFSGVNISPERIHFPPSEGSKLLEQCEEYERRIRDAGGIDIQILGIGSNGHIGFNEPTSSLASRTRVKTLAEKTLRDNSRFYGPGERPPPLAATMGIATILEARRIYLQAFGSKKADAIRASLEGPISSLWPGSALQLHPDVTVYLDPESASKLSLLDYYRRVEENERSIESRM
jgi:glucosamine-6-phosphate deaminase